MTDKNDPQRSEVPAELAEIDDEVLAELLTKLTAEFDKLVDEGSRDVAAMTALADDIDRVRGEGTAREEAAAQADAEVAALAERVRGPQAESPEPDPEPEPLPEPGEEPPPEPDAELEKLEKVPVAAAARPAARPQLGDVQRRVPKPRVDPKRSAVTITAAVDLPGISPGSKIDLNQVAVSMHDRARNLSMGPGTRGASKSAHPLARHRPASQRPHPRRFDRATERSGARCLRWLVRSIGADLRAVRPRPRHRQRVRPAKPRR
jgi:hypothetical protein